MVAHEHAPRTYTLPLTLAECPPGSRRRRCSGACMRREVAAAGNDQPAAGDVGITDARADVEPGLAALVPDVALVVAVRDVVVARRRHRRLVAPALIAGERAVVAAECEDRPRQRCGHAAGLLPAVRRGDALHGVRRAGNRIAAAVARRVRREHRLSSPLVVSRSGARRVGIGHAGDGLRTRARVVVGDRGARRVVAQRRDRRIRPRRRRRCRWSRG